ncbi:MAG: VOC family protein [Thermoanaerobaculia bacterium]
MPRTRGLAHVNLHVSDIDKSVRFYREVFGLEFLAEGTATTESAGQPLELRQAMLSTPGCEDLLALTHSASTSLPLGNAGVNHIGFNFESDEDVRTAVDVIPRYGGKVVREGEREQGGLREIFVYAEDPDGYIIEMSTQRGILALKKARQQKAPCSESSTNVL